MRRIPFQLRRLARAALGVLGTVAILAVLIGPPLSVSAAPVVRPLANYTAGPYTLTFSVANNVIGTNFAVTGNLVGVIWSFHCNSGDCFYSTRMNWNGGGSSGAWGNTSEFLGYGVNGCSLNSADGGTSGCSALSPGSTFYAWTNGVIASGTNSGFGFRACGSLVCSATVTFYLIYQGSGPTATPTATATTGPTATPGGPGSMGGNLIRNWDFNIGPFGPLSEWSALNRVVQAPLSLADPIGVTHLPGGSCGPLYWGMEQPLALIGPAGAIYQTFDWPGGTMFVNFEAVTDSYFTYGHAKVVNQETGSSYSFLPFTNGSNTWVSFKFLAPGQPAGKYSLDFSETGLLAPVAMVVDNVNLRTGYWGNDCPANEYRGTIPTNGVANPTAQPNATATYVPGSAGVNVLQNCNFESGYQNWDSNPAVSYPTTGGATGPTYAHLFELDIPTFPQPEIFLGDVSQHFNWPGAGAMYTSFWLQDGSAVELHLLNAATGFKRDIFTSSAAQTTTGWTQKQFTIQPDGPGQYDIEFQVFTGDVAGIDGVAIAPQAYATGGCATQDSSNASATQVAVNQTATAAASPTSGAATGTANAIATDDANAFATYAAGFYRTATAIWNAAGTAAAIQTQDAAANLTATQAARLTATAQGTPVPAATHTATPQPPGSTPTPTYPPPATVVIPPATLTQIAGDANATITAIWGGALTAQAAAAQTQAAAGTATQIVAKTATAAAIANQTAQAIANATAYARQTATAARATQAQATYNAGATQTALVIGGNATNIAAATQTQAAQQTQTQVVVLTADYNNTQRAAATQTALVATGDAGHIATATQQAALTATARAAATTEAAATTNANGTQQAHATGTSQAAATQTALVATANATNIAGATLTAVATVNAIATEQAQASATAQAQATVVAQGTQAVEPRPEPGPYIDCVRPTNPLWLADWIDFEFCRLMTWFVWSPTNSQQVSQLQFDLGKYEPLGTIIEISDARDELQDQLYAFDWARTGVQTTYTDTVIPDIGVFFPNHVATGLLAGNISLTPSPADPLRFLTICTLKVGDIFGQAVAEGLCASINWMIAIGIMGWVQYLFDLVTWIAFIRYGWHTATVTIPTML